MREDQTTKNLDQRYGDHNSAQALNEREKAYTSAGTDQAESYANNPANASKNIDDVKDREASSAYPAAGSVSNSWKQNFTGKNKTSNKFSLNKKKGPLAIITGLVLGGGFGFSMLLTPGIGIVHMKEILTESLSDHMGAVTVRQDRLLRAKLKKIQVGASLCTNTVSIRCKFSTMSKREVERFRKAGFEVDVDTNKLGRQRITRMVSPSGQVIKNPLDILNSDDPKLRNDLNRAMNPKYLSFMQPSGWLSRLGVSKAPQLEGNDKKSLDASLDKATSGETYDGGPRTRPIKTDENGERYVEKGGEKIYETKDPDGFKLASSESIGSPASEMAKKTSTGSHATNFLKSAGKGVAVTGVADTACTVYNTAQAVSAAAKVVRSAQMAKFAMIFLNTADEIKAGNGDPEKVSYIGDNLTFVDQREMISDEKTIEAAAKPEDIVRGERKNPYYGKSAFDSAGYAVGAFNDAPMLTSRDMQYTVGGALMGSFSPITSDITSSLGDSRAEIRKSCDVVQSWWVRGTGLVVGIVVGVGSFGWGTAALMGASIAVGFALPFLTAALADILAGKVVDSNTKGVDSGNAIFAGTSVLNGEIAKDYGMKPASKEDFNSYLASVQDVKRQNIETERALAKSTPFDIYNQYSFLGSLSRSIFPVALKAKQEPVAAFLSSPLKLSGALANFSTKAHAASSEPFNQERFERCKDDGYDELGIDADVFCNVRYSMSKQELAMDPIENVKWLEDRDYINAEGAPASSDNGKVFKDWIENCAERQDGWGETSEEEGGDIGQNCVKDSDPYPHFRVFRMDQRIDDSMSGEIQQAATSNVNDDSNGSPGGGLVSGESQELAKQIINSKNVSGDARYMNQIRAVSNGDNSCYINPTILQYIATMMKTYKLTISSLNRRCTGVLTASGTSSYHYRQKGGHAVDFNYINGVHSTGNTAEDIKFLKDSIKVLPSGTGIGQSQCRGSAKLSLPPGFTEFSDSCNHIHIQVPVK